jgi:hypothetical protein
MKNEKIATCCYCGTRAALVLDKIRHELSCSSCGAPLHDLKQIKSGTVDAHAHSAPRKGKKGKTRHEGWHGTPPHVAERKGKPDRRRKKRKSLTTRLFKEAFDVIEDIFD